MTGPVDPARGLLRGVRAAVLTVPAVGMAAVAHASGGGCTSWVGVVVAAGCSWPAAVTALGRRRSIAALAGWLLIAQVVTHVLLEQLCPDVMSGQMGLLQHLTMGLTPVMVGLHLGSVLVTAAVLGRADAGLWTARALLRAGSRVARVIVRLPIVTLVVTPGPQLPLPVAPVLRDLWKAPLPERRGPPALCAR